MSEDALPQPDRIDGAPHPRETAQLFGHGAAEATFLNAFNSSRLHHAWLLSGPRGIGKATAQSILSEGHRVVITARNQSVGESVVAELQQATGNKHISLIVGDLSTIKSSYELARRIKKDFPEIDTFFHTIGQLHSLCTMHCGSDQFKIS